MSDPGVTVVVRRTLRPGASEAFERWLRGIIDVASGFPGHGGVEVIRPTPGRGQDWVIVFRFDTREQLAAWEASEERRSWLEQVAPLTLSSSVEKLTGLEFWFTPPRGTAAPPPAWKMALTTLLGLFPLVLWLAPVLLDALEGWPHALAVFTTVALLVALMTWVVMPLLIRLLRPWLFPNGLRL